MTFRNVAWCFASLLLFLVCSKSFVASGRPQFSGDHEIGDTCLLSDGSSGVCKIDQQCPYFIDLIKRNRRNEIMNCGFKGINQIICCKADNEKFKRILCEEDVQKIPSKPVRFMYHILQGEQAEPAEFPHMASIGYTREGGSTEIDFRCGGTLIADNYVLTAAHCANRKNELPVVVRLGKTSLKDDLDSETGQDVKVGKIILHENYSSKSRLNDIALLKLEQPAQLAHNIWPACVSSNTRSLLTNLTIIGFGVVNNDDRSTSDWLLKTSVDETALDKCQQDFKIIPGSKPILKSQICASNPITFGDTCQGDSGGPIEYKKNELHYVYGITSYGLSCGAAFPSIYTRVDEYLDWLKDKMNL